MNKQVLLDLVSELFMMTQGAVELYRIVGSRAADADKAQYAQFMATSAALRDQLVPLIERIGGDPSYVSPPARMAQYTAERIFQMGLVGQELVIEERQIVDIESVIMLVDQAYHHWKLIAEPAGGGLVGKATQLAASAVAAVTGGEASDKGALDAMAVLTPVAVEAMNANGTVLAWARPRWASMNQALLMSGPTSPTAWPEVISNPLTPIQRFNPAPVTQGLLEGAEEPTWVPSSIVRFSEAKLPETAQ